MTELTTLGRAVDATAASMHDGAERSDTVAKMSNLLTRVQSLQQVLLRLLFSYLACLLV